MAADSRDASTDVDVREPSSATLFDDRSSEQLPAELPGSIVTPADHQPSSGKASRTLLKKKQPKGQGLVLDSVPPTYRPEDAEPLEQKQYVSRSTDKISIPAAQKFPEKMPIGGDPSGLSPQTGGGPTPSSLVSRSHSTLRSYQEHSFYHCTAFRMNHNIVTDSNNDAAYFVEVSGFTKGREDVVVRAMPHQAAMKGSTLTAEEGKTGPCTAFAQFPHGRNDFVRLALGDYERMNSVRWFDLSRPSELEEWTLSATGEADSVTFRLSTSGAESSMVAVDSSPTTPIDSKASNGSFKVIGAQHNMVMAAYTEQKAMTSWKKRGKLRLYDGTLSGLQSLEEHDVEVLIVLCCAVLNEKRRRKTVRKWAGMGVV